MAKSPLDAGHGHDDSHHIHPVGMYIKTAIILFCWMVATIVAAQYFHMPLIAANLVAIGIASIKAFFVVMNFMHVRWASNLAKLWALMGFFFLPVLFVITMDFWFRSHEPIPSWQGSRNETALPRKIGSTDGAPQRPQDTGSLGRLPKGGME